MSPVDPTAPKVVALVYSEGLYVGYGRRGSSQAEIFRDRGQATADQAWQVTLLFIFMYLSIWLHCVLVAARGNFSVMWELFVALCGLLSSCGMRAPELVGPSTGKDLP